MDILEAGADRLSTSVAVDRCLGCRSHCCCADAANFDSFQDDKGDVTYRYTGPQAEWLQQRGYLRTPN